jgi:hypothetical protein
MFMGSGAYEACGIVNAAAANVAGDLRIRTQRSSAVDRVGAPVRGHNVFGWLVPLYPVVKSGDGVEVVWTITPAAATAMYHARCHEQAHRFLRLPAEDLRNGVEVVGSAQESVKMRELMRLR